MNNPAVDESIYEQNGNLDSKQTSNANKLILTEEEKDALGEIGNICMGTSATTLFALLGKQVNITTPTVSVCYCADELGNYKIPYVAVEVDYTEGLEGSSLLLLKVQDVLLITDLLMGGEGDVDPETKLDELHISAISEVMNQMIGASATSLASILHTTVNIAPPKVKEITLEQENLDQFIHTGETIIKNSFSMTIEGLLESEIMQLMSYEFGKKMAHGLLQDVLENTPEPLNNHEEKTVQPKPVADSSIPAKATAVHSEQQVSNNEKNRIGVKSVQYQSFDSPGKNTVPKGNDFKDNISLIMDVPIQVTVELGKCKKSIKDILAMNVGSVIVLDRLAGEMVDVLVNGKPYAKGEVVVIDDSYGVRITDIIALPQI